MDRSTILNCCLGLLALILLQGVLNVDGRSTFNPGNHIFYQNEDTETQSKILALLFRKSIIPMGKDEPLGPELVDKLAEIEKLKLLKEDLELQREITANLAEGKSIPQNLQRRGEPCFWKYCV